MALPPSEMPPSLEVQSSEYSEYAEYSPSNLELLKAIRKSHDSVADQLRTLSKSVQQLQGFHRKTSISSNDSVASAAQSTSVRKFQANESVAMKALQMDISSLVPFSMPGTGGVPGSFGPSTASLYKKAKTLPKERLREDLEDASVRVLPCPEKLGKPELKTLPLPSASAASAGNASDCPTMLPAPSETTAAPPRRRSASVEMQRDSGECRAVHVKKASSHPDPICDGGVWRKTMSVSSAVNRSGRTSVELQQIVSKANLTEVFKVRELELTAQEGRNRLTVAEAVEEMSNEDEEKMSREVLREVVQSSDSSVWLKLSPLNTFVSHYLSKALGLMPIWQSIGRSSDKSCMHRCLDWMSRIYHLLAILYLLTGTIPFGYFLQRCYEAPNDEDCRYPLSPLATDLFLHVGASLVLLSLGGFWNYQDKARLVAQSAEELSSYCEQNFLDTAWKIWTCSDALMAILLWLALLFARFGIAAWHAWEDQEWINIQAVAFGLRYMVATGVLVMACFWQVRTSHAMLLIVNAWSASLSQGASCLESKNDWRTISGLFRKTSRTFELCFAALGLIVVMVAFAYLYDLQQGKGLEAMASLSVVVLIPGVLWTHASTTTACNRLPSLVTLFEVEDEQEDEEYMGLALFLSLSECGFFVWDTCITVGIVQKFLYFTAAMAGTVGFQSGALNFQN
ncbi:unnamed protein product [Durusdinium trenchii]|uniref:Transmembrane protein n=2 Tax=Durusdinium trenchii TaxID=1381693 RepID=A0ABP0N319_9DINO